MEGDIKRFIDVTSDRLETWRAAEMKVLVLSCIVEMLRLDLDGSQLDQVREKIVEGLQGVLKGTEAPEVMVSTVVVLGEFNRNHSHILNNYIQDIVDILVGWHIDRHHSSEVMKYVSLALQSFTQLWQMNVSIATTLLSQFVEDMEDYCEDLDRGLPGRSSPLSLQKKLLLSSDPQIEPTVNPILLPSFLVDALGKMITGAAKILQHQWEEALLDALNQVCLVLIPHSQNMSDLQGHFCGVTDLQQKLIEHFGFATILSYLTVLSQMLKQIGNSLSVKFIQKILGKDSFTKLTIIPSQCGMADNPGSVTCCP